MKRIASISLGPSGMDSKFKTRFLGHQFDVVRIGTDNDLKAAEDLVRQWRDKVNAIGLGMVLDHYWVGTNYFRQRDTATLEQAAGDTLVSTGALAGNRAGMVAALDPGGAGPVFQQCESVVSFRCDQLPPGGGHGGVK